MPSHQQAGVPTEIFSSKFSYVCVRIFSQILNFQISVMMCCDARIVLTASGKKAHKTNALVKQII